ncbi:type II toxin-antitoxin system HipA family toxin [Caulobacter vibrioides]|uniref:Toxin protein module HipA n=1 Tax=Caulobacter vibrioides (strain NA1000 / CB15N) TaxID=565050 RepID=A0A0H3C5Z1_CAUVN|nr:type II toxin-antitoxin system HipA family toxin [Caulobacter vibrioides]YP_002515855.1 toxin protein module HipA [Caulobacter vibrioides NA1000]ACL93947.1 toxin protein module HipA [Caulobacter vibrioides NA1000]ATC27299.1 type II toxin-antitoxin system HipA family toxin [Caulobacter vibrioides]AZH11681.1 type II toxin-antitoxin system HipA family toxin [Caulobacter vibrioides]
MAMTRVLTVWWGDGVVGSLALDETGDIRFAYDAAWLADEACPAVSVSLPKQPGAFSRRKTRSFFAGLLPDDLQRDNVARALGVSRQNDFGLLERLGGDVAGALTLWPEGEAPPKRQGGRTAEPLNDKRLLAILDELPRRPFLAGEDGVRLSLAGAQEKLPVVLVDGAVALPALGQPSTHILKPANARWPAMTENEALAMRLAAAVGLPTAGVEPRRIGERTFLLVTRYDRVVSSDGAVRRLHQEDFCQALGVSPEHKYAAEGGPIFPDCFNLVRNVCQPSAPAVLALLDAAIFNVIVGNADAHGKNYSLLHQAGAIVMAPLYDLMCTAAYPEVHAKLAMKIAGRAQLEAFKADTWRDFGRDIGMGPAFVERRANAQARRVLDQVGPVADAIAACGFDREALRGLRDLIAERARAVLKLGQGER